MNQNKISIILQNSRNEDVDETVRFLSMQQLTDNIDLELFTIDSPNMKDLQELIGQTDAYYKVFVQNGILLTNPYVLYNFINIFQSEEKIGMIGLSGNTAIPYDGIFWSHRNLGTLYKMRDSSQCCHYEVFHYTSEKLDYASFCGNECYALCGEIPLRTDLDLCEELIPVSFGFELQKKGKIIAIPRQEKGWCINMGNDLDINRYLESRDVLYQEYTPWFQMKD